MGLSRRQFTQEFKLAAVRRLEQGVSIAEVARGLEVNPNVLHRWRRELFAFHFRVTGLSLGFSGQVIRCASVAEGSIVAPQYLHFACMFPSSRKYVKSGSRG